MHGAHPDTFFVVSTCERADTLARAVREFVRQRRPDHFTEGCVDSVTGRPLAPEDWSAQGCEQLCSVCILNHALARYERRA
jgi:hypothetical protein